VLLALGPMVKIVVVSLSHDAGRILTTGKFRLLFLRTATGMQM